MRPADLHYFNWREPEPARAKTVGQTLHDPMAEHGWPGADMRAERANDIAPTIVGGPKRHGGAGLAMVARLQCWDANQYRWTSSGRKTTTYRQIGNAFL